MCSFFSRMPATKQERRTGPIPKGKLSRIKLPLCCVPSADNQKEGLEVNHKRNAVEKHGAKQICILAWHELPQPCGLLKDGLFGVPPPLGSGLPPWQTNVDEIESTI